MKCHMYIVRAAINVKSSFIHKGLNYSNVPVITGGRNYIRFTIKDMDAPLFYRDVIFSDIGRMVDCEHGVFSPVKDLN